MSHFIVILIHPNGYHVCAHAFDEQLECACLTRVPALAGASNASRVISPLWHLKQSPARVRVSGPHNLDETGEKLCTYVGHGCGLARRPEQRGSVAACSAILSETSPVLDMLFRSGGVN